MTTNDKCAGCKVGMACIECDCSKGDRLVREVKERFGQ